ncbi:hypothetical protein ASNO1_26090 [Corallococcus caeni]|uniref:Uncharacterized protein n=1 Tax=Corallococcus caeni TaxID=3082388 RepID=A0ABQ6QQR4_9BACT|nr:hypothetical protein ASNO1_26090 [Corallococcus sp. NO1]
MEEATAWRTETAKRAEPVSDENAEHPASSAAVSSIIRGMEAFFMGAFLRHGHAPSQVIQSGWRGSRTGASMHSR